MTLRSSWTMVRKSSSVSRWNDCRRLPSKSGESGLAFFSSRRNSHCPAKLVTSASARGSASMRRTCRSSDRRVLQRAAPRRIEQLIVRNAAPQEERQPRRQLEIAQAERGARRRRWPARARIGRGTADRRARATPRAGCRTRTCPPCVRRRRTRAASSSRRRCSVTGRRYARVASVLRIFAAHGCSSAADAGVQISSRRRLGVSPGPVALCGPAMVTCVMPGVRGST